MQVRGPSVLRDLLASRAGACTPMAWGSTRDDDARAGRSISASGLVSFVPEGINLIHPLSW